MTRRLFDYDVLSNSVFFHRLSKLYHLGSYIFLLISGRLPGLHPVNLMHLPRHRMHYHRAYSLLLIRHVKTRSTNSNTTTGGYHQGVYLPTCRGGLFLYR